MKFVLIFTLVFFTFQSVFSQVKDLDSIKKLNQNYTKRDSIRVKNLIRYTKFTAIHNDKESEKTLNEALNISKEINYTKGISDSFGTYALYYVRQGDFKQALLYAEKAKKIQDSIHDITGLIITNTAIANVYNQLNQPKKAIVILKENLELLKDDNPNKAAIHFYLAKAHQTLKQYNNAEMHYNKAKKIAELTNFTTGVSIANSSIGIIKIEKGEYKKGIEYIEKALVFFKTNKQTANIAHSYIEIANAYSKLKKIDKAIDYNNKAITIYKNQNTLKTLKHAYLNHSEYLLLKNNYKESNFYLKEHYKIKDSIFSNENVKNIAEMQAKYETEKTILEKEVALEKNKKNKTLFYSTLLTLILLLLSSLFYFEKYKERKKTELILTKLKETQKRLALEKQYRSSELKALKAQMDPHFIFNALNSIQEYIILNKKNLASDYLGKFADLMRKYLYHSDKGSLSLQEEIDTLKIYLDLEKVRFEDTLNYKFNIDSSLTTLDYKIPTMLVQPYVENALKHGLLHLKNNRELELSFFKKENCIECIIQDNGVGRKKAKEIKEKKNTFHKSFATKATQERLDLLNFGKDKKIGVEIIDLFTDNNEPTGTKVILKIPILK